MKAVVMAGGQGTRFWPASRRNRPKQFLNILGQRTMLQETMTRLEPLLKPADLYVVCREDYVDDVKTQAPGLSDAQIIAEPLPRNTAACIGLGALRISLSDPEEVMVALPADHRISNVSEFQRALEAAENLARDGWLVTFGIRPTYPATGYGYLERGPRLGEFNGREAFEVVRFVEKPKAEMASEMLTDDRYDWNSGIFIWKTSRILKEIEASMPALYEALTRIKQQPDNVRVARAAFRDLEHVSIDHGVMEKSQRVACLPVDLGWSDVGSWRVVADLLPADEAGNVANSFLVPLDSRGCVVHTSPEKLVALIGVEDLVVVETADAVLVCPKDRAEEVQQVVAELQVRGLEEFL